MEKTLSEARIETMRDADKGVSCPCCDQFVKIYKRSLYKSSLESLVHMYRWTKAHPDEAWFHMQNLLGAAKLQGVRGGDVQKLRFWGLLEKKNVNDKRDPNEKGAGHYRLTDLAIAFVEGRVKLPKSILMYNGKARKSEESELVSIRDCIGKGFDFEALMAPAS